MNEITIHRADDYPPRDFNVPFKRFHADYWTCDYNALMSASIVPYADDSFIIAGQWRTNADFLGVMWNTEDTKSHDFCKYSSDADYSGTILAFRSNPAEPDKFTATITAPEGGYTYKLAPYGWDATKQKWVCLDKLFPTGKEYGPEVMKPRDQWRVIPDDEMEVYADTRDYIYILDFDNIFLYDTYLGPKIDPRYLNRISFDITERTHGLGSNAYVWDIRQTETPGLLEMVISGANPGAQLTAGDALQVIFVLQNGNQHSYNAIVESYTGFGTAQLTVRFRGEYVGPFREQASFYSRYLKTQCPAKLVDSKRYFYDMTVTGRRTMLRKRYYPQALHGIEMTSGYDDSYDISPQRLVDQVYELGYRGHWNKYIGMSHYFSGRTGYLDKDTGEFIAPADPVDYTTLFAGQSNAAGHFVIGQRPNRGVDEYQREMAARLGAFPHQFVCINGATGSTAADRAASINPNSEVFDPDQTGDQGGLWWWDLDHNKPGPAFEHCILQVGTRVPKSVIWSQGGQDANAIRYVDSRPEPKPSYDRTRRATEAIFAHMRALWGERLPIFIQELNWSWATGMTNPAIGEPLYLSARRNTWGDVEMSWLAFKDDPSTRVYTVEVEANGVIYSHDTPGSRIIDNRVTFDYVNEINVPDAVAAFGDQFPWTYMKWRVRVKGTEIVSHWWEDNVKLDDKGLTKKLVAMGINSLIGGYFNDLSDPLDPGGTGKPGRKDVVAASTFRKELADGLGIRWIEVQPVMCVVGSSPITVIDYLPGFDPENYWWDLGPSTAEGPNYPVSRPGPNLIYAHNILKPFLDQGLTVSYFTESGPGETDKINALDYEEWPRIIQRFKDGNRDMLAWMRANWGNPDMDIWLQGATTSWWGDPPPRDTNALGTQTLRDAQIWLMENEPGFKLGSYVPNSNLYTTFRNEMAEGLGWIHYTVEGYHAAAQEMGYNMARDINVGTPPEWVNTKPGVRLRTVRNTFGDLVLSFQPQSDEPTRRHRLNIRSTAADQPDLVLRTVEFTGADIQPDGRIYFSYPVELNAPDVRLMDPTANYPMSTLYWNVTTFGIDDPTIETVSSDFNGPAAYLDKEVSDRHIAFVGDANVMGHFNLASSTQYENNSAAQFRRQLAALMGVPAIKVNPINLGVAGSALERQANGSSFYWDLGTNGPGAPGAELLSLIGRLQRLEAPVTDVVWTLNLADALAWGQEVPQWFAGEARYTQALQGALAYLNSAINCKIWMTGVGRIYYGPTAGERMGQNMKDIDDAQLTVRANLSAFVRVGAYEFETGFPRGYEADPQGWYTTYKSTVFASIASKLADAIFNDADQSGTRPYWRTMDAPTNLDGWFYQWPGHKMFWEGRPGVQWRLRNFSVLDFHEISNNLVTGNVWNYSQEEQTAGYGYRPVSFVSLTLAEYEAATGAEGPAAVFNKEVFTRPGTKPVDIYRAQSYGRATQGSSRVEVNWNWAETPPSDCTIWMAENSSGSSSICAWAPPEYSNGNPAKISISQWPLTNAVTRRYGNGPSGWEFYATYSVAFRDSWGITAWSPTFCNFMEF